MARSQALTLAAMCAHVDLLIAAEDARRSPDDGLQVYRIMDRNDARAVTGNEFNELQLPVINDARDYAVALHEFGRLLGRYQTSRNSLTRERWAWAWARKEALHWTTEMEAEATEALRQLKLSAPWRMR
jgi:hypothetical protein